MTKSNTEVVRKTLVTPKEEFLNDLTVKVIDSYYFEGELQYEICEVTTKDNEKLRKRSVSFTTMINKAGEEIFIPVDMEFIEDELDTDNYIITWLPVK